MRYFLENEQIKAEIESFGAELKSLVDRKTGQEYMWEADPAFWGKTSPILFPFIGKLEGAGFLHEGKRYGIEKHGFARDMEFTAAAREADQITFFMESNEETLQKFPFDFRLEITYVLKGKGLLENWRIVNKGADTMCFSIGGHPAFACPPVDDREDTGTRRTDCFLKLYDESLRPFGKKEVQSTEIMVPEELLSGAQFPLQVENSMIKVGGHLFDKDALCLEKQGVGAVGICDAGNIYVWRRIVRCGGSGPCRIRKRHIFVWNPGGASAIAGVIRETLRIVPIRILWREKESGSRDLRSE